MWWWLLGSGGTAEEFGSWVAWGLKIWASVGVRGGSQRASPWHRLSAQVVCVCVCVWVWVTQSCLTLCDPVDYSPPGSSVHEILQARKRVGCHSLHQGIFPAQGLNLGLPHHWQISYRLNHQGNPPARVTDGYELTVLMWTLSRRPADRATLYLFMWFCLYGRVYSPLGSLGSQHRGQDILDLQITYGAMKGFAGHSDNTGQWGLLLPPSVCWACPWGSSPFPAQRPQRGALL